MEREGRGGGKGREEGGRGEEREEGRALGFLLGVQVTKQTKGRFSVGIMRTVLMRR